jgi:C1A family cysteine protease
LETGPDSIKDEDLPNFWDWRNVEGFDFTGPVRDQRGCGSCYAISFISSIESRIRIMTGENIDLSP